MSAKVNSVKQAEEIIAKYDSEYSNYCKEQAAFVSGQRKILYAESLLRIHSDGYDEEMLYVPGEKRNITVAVPMVCTIG